MEKRLLKLITGLTAVCVICGSPAAAGAAGYKDLSAGILRFAKASAIKKIAVLEFTGKGGVGKSETEYAAEKIGLYLAGSKTTELIERALLEQVLKETSSSAAADGMADKTEILKSMFSLDAVVTGMVFPDGARLKVLVKLIELKTGRVLLASEGVAGRLPLDSLSYDFAGAPFGGGPIKEPPFWPEASAPVLARAALRDAVADLADSSCPARQRLLAKLNAELVDEKARYWAVKLNNAGGRQSARAALPGSEIGDSDVKAVFQELLAAYLVAGKQVRLSVDELSKVLNLVGMEKVVFRECRAQ